MIVIVIVREVIEVVVVAVVAAAAMAVVTAALVATRAEATLAEHRPRDVNGGHDNESDDRFARERFEGFGSEQGTVLDIDVVVIVLNGVSRQIVRVEVFVLQLQIVAVEHHFSELCVRARARVVLLS